MARNRCGQLCLFCDMSDNGHIRKIVICPCRDFEENKMEHALKSLDSPTEVNGNALTQGIGHFHLRHQIIAAVISNHVDQSVQIRLSML